MKTFLQDDFLNKKLLDKIRKEIKKDQLDKTIDEINYLNTIQNHVLSQNKFATGINQELEFTKKLDNARRKQNL